MQHRTVKNTEQMSEVTGQVDAVRELFFSVSFPIWLAWPFGAQYIW